MNETLLAIHLSCCVPLAIEDLHRCGGPLDSDYHAAREFASVLGGKADQILYRGKETAALVSGLVRSMAVMAFAPGGVHFRDVTYCATHHRGGIAAKHCPECCEVCAISNHQTSPK